MFAGQPATQTHRYAWTSQTDAGPKPVRSAGHPVVAATHYWLKLNAILAFWIAYILTCPLGASLGDYFSQPAENGGLGPGTVVTSAIFLLAILAAGMYLSVTKRDAIPAERIE
jgi:uncharacterized membrane-anchored protein